MDTPKQNPRFSEAVAVHHCTTVNEFISALSLRNPIFTSAGPRGWIFRGHANDAYSLIPTALRDEPNGFQGFTSRSIKNNVDQVMAERQVLTEFLQGADSIGLHVPEDTQILRGWLDQRFHRVEVWPPDEMLSLMALAQHHGVPTRLLDWSRHPLKAALFAAFGAYESKDTTGLMSVWALAVEQLNVLPAEARPFVVVTAPSATNANLRAQEGVFTLAKRMNVDDKPVDRTPFDLILQQWVQKHSVGAHGVWLHRITLPRSCAAQLCFELALEGFTRATLFPDFYGVVTAMKDHVKLYAGPETPGGQRAAEYLGSFHIVVRNKVPTHTIRPITTDDVT